MSIMLRTPDVDGLAPVLAALREWQYDDAPMVPHPGDLGWHWRFGAATVAGSVRTWSRAGRILAVGLVDPGLVRLAVAPSAHEDVELADRMAEDVTRPDRGVLSGDQACVEARWAGPFPELLRAAGWRDDEPWTPLARDLTAPVPDCGLRVEVTGPEDAGVRAEIQRASFERSTFTEDRWHAMAAGPAYRDARCLVGRDDRGAAVAAVTVWSAGPGRPGLLEPLGVHPDHRGHRYGTAIAVAAAAALRELGASVATVCTPADNRAAVATYRSAGFRQLPDVRDLCRG